MQTFTGTDTLYGRELNPLPCLQSPCALQGPVSGPWATLSSLPPTSVCVGECVDVSQVERMAL